MPPQHSSKGNGTSDVGETVVLESSTTPHKQQEDIYHEEAKNLILHPTTSLPLLNMFDMISVALVVPLLNQYFLDAGVTSASQRELLSSLFSSSQIIGGFIIGGLLDVGILSRKHSLYLSFLGSSLSYALIVYGGMKGLIVSRVVVGLIKQTSTISTSMISSYTDESERSIYMGRLTASTTLAFVVGPSIGAFLYKNVDKKAPALLASLLFILNFILAAIFIPSERNLKSSQTKNTDKRSSAKKKSFYENIKSCFSSKELGSVILSLLLYSWISRATSYASMASYYEQMFQIEPHQRGYIRSYTSILSFLFQTFFVKSTMKKLGNEYNAACVASCFLAFTTLLEFSASFHLFLVAICPIVAISNAILRLSLRSLVTLVAPKEFLGSVLAALDVLQNAAAVTVPFYRTLLFKMLAQFKEVDEDSESALMIGDPNPTMWLKSSLLHWVLATFLLFILLRGNKLHVESNSTEKKEL